MTDQNILHYLASYQSGFEKSFLYGHITETQEKLHRLKHNLPSITSSVAKALNQERLRASNTLSNPHNKSDLALWNKAQTLLHQLIEANRPFLSLSDVQKLHQYFQVGPSYFRKQTLRTGAGEYLSPHYLESAWKKFEEGLSQSRWDHERLAFETYLHLVTIHPFEDGNGRVARLCADFYLLKAEALPLIFPSPFQAHVAMVKNLVPRDKDQVYLGYLQQRAHLYEKVTKALKEELS